MVRSLVFASWPDGAVDTTALFSDHINNPGVVTAFWEHENRLRFDVGMAHAQLRNGQGGEDDIGDLAFVRVYLNIGACFFECSAPAAAAGTEIDIDSCKESCAAYPPQQDLDDIANFLASFRRPRYPDYPRDWWSYIRGYKAFRNNCADCHERSRELRTVLSNDEVNALADDPDNATNACRSLTSNWQGGKLWGQFSSQLYKDRLAAGGRGYRTMPLGGIWATAPFTHNQSIGVYAEANASPEERAAVYRESMLELLSTDREPLVHVTPFALGDIPAGTPLHYIVSRDPATGAILCDDLVENKGHYYGADLSMDDKEDLIYWLQYQ